MIGKYPQLKHDDITSIRLKYGEIGLYDAYGVILQDCGLVENISRVPLGFDSAVFENARVKDTEAKLLRQSENEGVQGLYQCRNPKCKSWRTKAFVSQVRSADEGETCFIRCLEPGCNERWIQQ